VETPRRAVVGYRLAALTVVLLPLVTALVSAGRWAARNPLTFAESGLEPAMLAVLLGLGRLPFSDLLRPPS
jgi:hypothetical protein